MHHPISSFIAKQTTATICCIENAGRPYCFNCYYVFDQENGFIYFKSEANTHHSEILAHPQTVAGTILPDIRKEGMIIGIQLQGEMISFQDPLAIHADKRYHVKYPFALSLKGDVYTIRLDLLKMTDSQLGFGKKIIWNRYSKNEVLAEL